MTRLSSLLVPGLLLVAMVGNVAIGDFLFVSNRGIIDLQRVSASEANAPFVMRGEGMETLYVINHGRIVASLGSRTSGSITVEEA